MASVRNCRSTTSSLIRMEFIPFSEKLFQSDEYSGPGKEEFTAKLNEEFAARPELKEGYAPFCKHFFVKNFTALKSAHLVISQENASLIRIDYVARTENELPVLSRWVPNGTVTMPVAAYLDVILYSREQIKKESEAMNEEFTLSDGVEWGIVSIKPQDVDYETPMQPITILRNALGKEEGGSGVPLEKEKYAASVEYWKKHVLVQ